MVKINPKLLLNAVYPVGSIYMNINYVNPANIFGGTWEQLKDRFLLGSGNTYQGGATGGEATHTLTIDEMPQHNHQSGVSSGGSQSGWGLDYTANSTTYRYYGGTDFINNAGGGQAHNNMPPYLVVYMWKRTA